MNRARKNSVIVLMPIKFMQALCHRASSLCAIERANIRTTERSCQSDLSLQLHSGSISHGNRSKIEPMESRMEWQDGTSFDGARSFRFLLIRLPALW